ncbi:MAG: TIGR03013 family PEP-CTERM/XrtA system glycosyltransferase [Candidatus Omnitrophica bacterium]|nr:TIGR03013 family PEP-CTERM/XrtA system glycosyltransferase [Candidatus Omnitrophota bacterium]
MSIKLLEYISLRKLLFIIGEAILIYLSVIIAIHLLWGTEYVYLFSSWKLFVKTCVIVLIIQSSLYLHDLYEIKKGDDLMSIIRRVGRSMGIACICLAFLYYLLPALIIGRGVVIVSLFVLAVLIASWRLLYAYSLRKKIMSERIMLLGLGKLSTDIAKEIVERKELVYSIVAIATQKEHYHLPKGFEGIAVKKGFDDLYAFVQKENITSIIVAMDERRGAFPFDSLLECKTNGIDIQDGVNFYETITGKLIVERINPSWLIFSDGFKASFTRRIVKRALDFSCALIGLIMLMPLLVLTAILIKLESKGPVFFVQERVGRWEKPFMLYKFRSMRKDAEKQSGPVWAEAEDPRITRIGKIIRKTRIDELPQLWNVLKGEMSIVGPRPERRFFVEQLKKKIPYYTQRFVVKPGLTGWAQILFMYGSSEEDAAEKLRHELYYIKNMSTIMDLVIMFGTLKIVILGRGAQ